MQITDHKIFIGDSRDMSDINDSSVHLIITSPPYWQLKDYGVETQIGFDNTYEDYINNLNLVWQECYRVLHSGCRLCINIGDQFARSVYYGRYKIIPIRTEIIKFCETIGMDYMGAIIWQKVTTCNTTGGASVMGSFPFPRNGILKLDYEFILIFKKLGNPPKMPKHIKEQSKLTTEEWNTYFSGHWTFPGERQDRHLAMFPEELPKRLIKMFSFKGDYILDPFTGSGTTTLAAKHLERNSIGYEINPEFTEIIRKKVGLDQNEIWDNHNIKIINKKMNSRSAKYKIEELPYIFHDPIKFQRKIDPRKMSFGSRIDNSKSSKIKYFKIKKIISPEVLLLDNNQQITLLGIKNRPDKIEEAIDFLNRTTKGENLYLKFDEIKYDENDNLLVYLYLKNKTFINAHLVKRGLVYVDSEKDFKYKAKFMNYRKT